MNEFHRPEEFETRNEPRRLSGVFVDLAENSTGPVAISSIRDALGDRSFAALLAFFAAINLLPLPPGTTLVLGVPLLIVSAQMVAGSKTVWLPRSVLDKSLKEEQFRHLTSYVVPKLIRLEQIVRPRYWPFLSRPQADRMLGLITLIMGLAVTLPIPFGNWLPALSILLHALALSERDGLLLAAGVATAFLALVVICVVLGTFGAAAHFLFV